MQKQKNLQQSLWGITSYYNPCGYKRRLHNYKIFRKYLEIPLITVELSYNGSFELTAEDADILIQIHGTNVMWQKERLLNIALKSLPEFCTKVAWLDCDIIIPQKSWVQDTITKLNNYIIIQPFQKVHHLPPDIRMDDSFIEKLHTNDQFFSEYSYGCMQTSESKLPDNLQIRDNRFSEKQIDGCPGVLWAARKELLLEHGFYDAFIAGGGDTAFIYAAHGRMHDLPLNRPMNEHQESHFLQWAEPFNASVNNSFSFLEYDIYHLWHGHFKDRNYQERHTQLAQLGYNPYTDIVADKSGCWCWANEKTDLNAYLKTYFACRKEDG